MALTGAKKNYGSEFWNNRKRIEFLKKLFFTDCIKKEDF